MRRMLRIALVGTGRWTSAHHLPALLAHDDVEVVAVVDPDRERAADAARRAGARVVADAAEVGASDAVDGVVVATPNDSHAALAESFLARGVGVLLEKPLATTADDAFRLAAVAESAAAPLHVGYTPLYSPAAAAVPDWVREGIGELRQVSIEFHSRAGALYGAYADDQASAYSAARGGGQATTQLTHAVAAMCVATGDEVARVVGFLDARGGGADVDDACVFVLAGGVSGAAVSSGALGPGEPLRHRIAYTGTRGRVVHDLLGSRARIERGNETVVVAPGHLEAPYPAAAPVDAFLGALRGGAADPPVSVRAAAAVVAFTESLAESARTARVVAVPPVPVARRRGTA